MKNVAIFIVSVFVGLGVILLFKQSVKKPSDFSVEKAPTQSLRGKIASMSGEIKWESRMATAPAAITTPVIIQQGESIETGEDGSVDVEFRDMVHIAAASQTKLDFAQTLPEHIVIIQSLGTAHYKTMKSSHVAVRSMHILAELSEDVDFTIEKEEEVLRFDVQKGSVTVAFNNRDNISTIKTFNEGNQYIYNDSERTAELQ